MSYCNCFPSSTVLRQDFVLKLKSKLEIENKFIFLGVKTKIKKQTPTTNVHPNKTFTQSVQIPSKIKIKPLPPLHDQKAHLSCLFSASSTSTQRSGKEEQKGETDRDRHKLVFLCLQKKYILSKANQKLLVFPLGFYYFYSNLSLNTSLKYSVIYTLF